MVCTKSIHLHVTCITCNWIYFCTLNNNKCIYMGSVTTTIDVKNVDFIAPYVLPTTRINFLTQCCSIFVTLHCFFFEHFYLYFYVTTHLLCVEVSFSYFFPILSNLRLPNCVHVGYILKTPSPI